MLDDRRIRIRNTGKGNMRVLQKKRYIGTLDSLYLTASKLTTSVADPGCLSRILDPKTATKERDKKNGCSTCFCGHKNRKIENYINLELVKKKKIWANLRRIIELSLPKKLSLSSQKYWFGIRDPEKTYSGSRIPRGQKGTVSRICNTV